MHTNGSMVRLDRTSLIEYEAIPEETAKSSKVEYETDKGLTDDRWLISVKDGQFPPAHMEWLRDFERDPDQPLKKSYRSGVLLPSVDQSAPVLSIAMTFMAGADKPTVAKAEMSKISDLEPPQKSHEWRMFTAATLLQRFEIGTDLSIQKKDNSYEIMIAHKERKGQRNSRSPSSSMYNEPIRGLLTKSPPDMDESMAVIKRNVQGHTLTIDSDKVKLMHDLPMDGQFDIACTLIEIDMFSMRDLMTNYRTIVQDGGRNIAAKEIVQILDAMINDVRRLCIRSPRLFRMSTRALIAQSTNTRYGVDYGSLFVTLTTSEGIRKLVEQSSSYYLSLNESKTEQAFVKPKFMQMLVMLLALLNNDDLKKITKVLESTFQIPGDRESIELIIMKVLPLGAINPEIFLQGLFEAYKPLEKKEGGYELRLQRKIWEELQQDLANKGYLVPCVLGISGYANQTVWTTNHADDLEAMLGDLEMDDDPFQDPGDHQSSTQYPYADQPNQGHQFSQAIAPEAISWQAPWPIDGVTSSSIFKYLQHDGLMRERGNSSGLVRVVNEIPHLDISSDDRDDTLLASFTNFNQYRVSSFDIEYISAMQKGTYTLKTPDNAKLANLEISDEVLNEPFVEATRIINILVSGIRTQFGGRMMRRRLTINRNPSITSFTPLDEVTEAKKFSADIVSPNGERERIAEAFKIGNRVVYIDDLLREMNSSLTKITAAAERLQKELDKHSDIKGTDEASRIQRGEVEKLDHHLTTVKTLISQAKENRTQLQQVHRNLPEDPIKSVMYPSFTQMSNEKPEWQPYQSQLARDGARLIVKGKKLTIANIRHTDNNLTRLSFAECSVILAVEALLSVGNEVPYLLRAGQMVLWLGYYIVVVEPHAKKKNMWAVQAYFRVQSQSLQKDDSGQTYGMNAVPMGLTILV
jgi:hypothetical protein